MKNPLLITLQLIEALGRYDAGTETLGRQLDLSPATVKRYIADARLLGADIVSARVSGLWVYELRNWPSIKARTLRWIELEETRNLTTRERA